MQLQQALRAMSPNAAGHVIGANHGPWATPDRNRRFVYDSSGQLVAYGDSAWTYNAAPEPCTRSLAGDPCPNRTQNITLSAIRSGKYVYDSVGNRKDSLVTGGGLDPGNRLRRWGNYRMDYDAAGNLVAKRTLKATDTTQVVRRDSLFWSALRFLIFISVHPDGRGVATIPSLASGPADYRVAQLALFILRASSVGRGSADQNRVVILPDKRPLNWEDAVWALARREKPVLCSTTSSEAMLEISCQRIPDPRIAATLVWRGQSFVRAITAQVTPREDGGQGDHLILMQDESDRSLVVSVSTVEAFFRDFDVTFGSAVHTSGSGRSLQGVVGMWKVGRPLRFESRGAGGTIVGGPK